MHLPINVALYMTPIMHSEERSYGDSQDTTTTPLTHYLPLIGRQDERSKSKGYWAGTIAGRMREGWRVGYTDGTGANGMAASAVYSEYWRGFRDKAYGTFLGPLSSVADAERRALALGMEKESAGMLLLLTDSQTALRTAITLSRGQPPRSGVEV